MRENGSREKEEGRRKRKNALRKDGVPKKTLHTKWAPEEKKEGE